MSRPHLSQNPNLGNSLHNNSSSKSRTQPWIISRPNHFPKLKFQPKQFYSNRDYEQKYNKPKTSDYSS